MHPLSVVIIYMGVAKLIKGTKDEVTYRMEFRLINIC